MPFISPLALLGLVFFPAVIAMYLLKLRRDRAPVPSTLLWQKLVADVEANAPWQKLRRSLLLLIQLLLVLLLVFLAARPFIERPAGLAQDIVLVIDTSASMQATDVAPDRLTAAKQAAIESLKDLPSGGKVSVIAAGRTAKVVANGTSDLGRVRQAIESIEPTTAAGDLGDALRLASALAARSGDAEIVVATDASLARPLVFAGGGATGGGPAGTPVPGASGSPSAAPSVSPAASSGTGGGVLAGILDAPVRVLQVGRDRENQALAALAVRTASSGVSRSVFVSIANLDIERVERRIELYGDGQLLESQDKYLEPQARTDVVIDDLPTSVRVVEVRLTTAGGDPDPDASIAGDDLAVDDRAWAIVPPDRLRRVLLVGDGDPYLETALSYLPDSELYGVTPDKYGTGHEARAVRPDHLRGQRAGAAPGEAHAAHRAAEGFRPRRCQRHHRWPGDRCPRARRAHPPLRRPLDAPHRVGAEADAPVVGAGDHPGAGWRAAAVHGDALGDPGGRPGVRAATLRPATPGRVPDPHGEPHRRAAGRLLDTPRFDRPGLAGDPAHPRWRHRDPRRAP